jgi:hypothetical protein
LWCLRELIFVTTRAIFVVETLDGADAGAGVTGNAPWKSSKPMDFRGVAPDGTGGTSIAIEWLALRLIGRIGQSKAEDG